MHLIDEGAKIEERDGRGQAQLQLQLGMRRG